MPRKLRQLKADYRKLGFTEDKRGGKGSHSKWTHPLLPGMTIVLSGRDGDDIEPYQERDWQKAIERLQEVS
ncbi:MAG: type II toxin-antitoxin system HicA family toxin [Thermomicrobiales bacterium]